MRKKKNTLLIIYKVVILLITIGVAIKEINDLSKEEEE
jgi:hypothetical protein